MDDTVHFLSKYLRARREQGADPQDAVRYAFSSVGTALVVTSGILVVGFMVLSSPLVNNGGALPLIPFRENLEVVIRLDDLPDYRSVWYGLRQGHHPRCCLLKAND